MNSKVSIIMPFKNNGETITEAVVSLKKQCFDNWELLAIDDHSVDEGPRILHYEAEKDERIIVVKNEGKGVSKARNTGLGNCTGKYVAFLDADDVYLQNALSGRVDLLEKNCEYDATYCKTVLTDERLKPLGWEIDCRENIGFRDFYRFPMSLNSFMIRKKTLIGHHFDEKFANGEDWLFMARLARAGVIIYGCRKGAVVYRQRQGTVRKDMQAHENGIRKVIRIIYGKDPGCKSPIREYECGIRQPAMKSVLLEREVSLFYYHVISGDKESIANASVRMKRTYKELRSIGVGKISSCVKFSVIRNKLCHESEWLFHFIPKSYEFFKGTSILFSTAKSIAVSTHIICSFLGDRIKNALLTR